MVGRPARRVLLIVILLLVGLAPGGCFYALDGSLVDRTRDGGADGPRRDGGSDADAASIPDGPRADSALAPDSAAVPDQQPPPPDAAPGG